MKRATFFSAIIAFTVLLSHVGCKFQVKLDGWPEREVFSQQVRQLLATEQVDALEKMANHLRTSKARFPEGIWILRHFYAGVEKPVNPDSEAQWKAWFEKLDRWRGRHPNSKTAAIALGKAYFEYGWKARGTDYAGKVTKQGWRLLEERLAKSRKILEDAAHLPPEDPEWYSAMLSIALGQSWADAAYDRLYDEAVSKEPTYYDYYFLKANRLLPRWHGNPGDWQRFALEAASKSSKEEGMTLYARIVWANGVADYKNDLFTKGGIQWTLMKQGFEDIERNYPKSIWNLNAFCYYACMAKDQQTARNLFERIADHPHPGIWRTEAEFERNKAWALAGGSVKDGSAESHTKPTPSLIPFVGENSSGRSHFDLKLIVIACILYLLIFSLYPKIVGRDAKPIEKLCLWIVYLMLIFLVVFANKLFSPGPLHNYVFGAARKPPVKQPKKENVPAVVDEAISSHPDFERLKKGNPQTFHDLRRILIEGIETRRPLEQIVDAVLQNDPFCATIKRHDPVGYQKDLAFILDAAKAGRTQEQLRQLRDQLVENQMNRYMSSASDEAVLTFSRVKIAAAQQICAKGPEVGFEYFWGEDEHNLDSLLSTNVVRALTGVFARVVKTATATPQTPRDKKVMESRFDNLMVEFRKVHGDDVNVLADEKAASANKKRACQLMLELYKKALELPPEDACMVFRHLWGSK